LSDFLLDLHQSLAHQGFAKSLDISIGMPALFANLAASIYRHISSQKIAQLRFKTKFLAALINIGLGVFPLKVFYLQSINLSNYYFIIICTEILKEIIDILNIFKAK
jgi:hypothetical protein